MTAVNQLYVHLKPKGRDGRATHSLDAQQRQLWSKRHAIKVIQGMWGLSYDCSRFIELALPTVSVAVSVQAATKFVTRAKAIRVNFACHTNHIPFATWLSLRHCYFLFRFRARFPMHCVSWCLSVFVGSREGGRQPQVWLCDFVSGSIRNMPPNAEQWPSCSRCWKLWKLWSNQRPQRWPDTAIDLLPPPPLPPSRSRSNSLTVSWGSTPTLQWLLMLPQHSHMWHMRPWLQLQTDFATGLPGWRLVDWGQLDVRIVRIN